MTEEARDKEIAEGWAGRVEDIRQQFEPVVQEPSNEFGDHIEWEPVELEAPTCDLENPDICETCT